MKRCNKQKKQYNTQKFKLLTEFHDLGDSQANDIDTKMKSKVQIEPDIAENRLIDYMKSLFPEYYHKRHDDRRYRKKIARLALSYKENQRLILKQENLACIFVLIITNLLVVIRAYDLDTCYNDVINLMLYFVASMMWIIFVNCKKLDNKKIEMFLNAVNRHAGYVTLTEMLIFYCYCFAWPNLVALWAVLVLAMTAVYLSFQVYWYHKNLKSSEE